MWTKATLRVVEELRIISLDMNIENYLLQFTESSRNFNTSSNHRLVECVRVVFSLCLDI